MNPVALKVTPEDPPRGAGASALPQFLVDEGLLSTEDIARACHASEQEKQPLWRVLIRDGLVLSSDLAALTAMRMGLSMVDLRNSQISTDAVALIPEDVARRYTALAIEADPGGPVVVAMAGPSDLQAVHDLTAVVGSPIQPVVATPEDVQEHIDIYYRLSALNQSVIDQFLVGGTDGRGGLMTSADGRRVTPTDLRTARPSEVVDLLVAQAIQDRASDIHIEATEGDLRVRFRIDGLLHDVIKLPAGLLPALISRLKIMSGMNIAERRRSQDGQFSVDIQNRKVDVRVAIARTIHGEMAVLRLLDKDFTPLGLDQLGMGEQVLASYRRLLRVPHGMIVVCGPTGSGKSTTLYASTLQLNRIEQNVVTLEDPVEYQIANTNQMQIHPQAGITFATQLRSTLRLDPDVILVGEIRDEETAVIATQAALTGHLVMTSLHANDSVSALLRLRDLGVPPYLIASSVAGIVAQRMVRVTCSGCRTEVARPRAEIEAYAEEMGEERERFLQGAGCNVCAHTGYRGRAGVFEVLSMTDELRELFLADALRANLVEQALRDGMTPIKRDGMLKVRDGITTPYEVMRVLFSLD